MVKMLENSFFMFLSKPLFFHLLLCLNSICCLFYIFLFYRKCYKASNILKILILPQYLITKTYRSNLLIHYYEIKLKLGIK